MDAKELERKELMLSWEIQTLTEKVAQIELEMRSRLDSFQLEIKAIEAFLEWAHPDTKEKLREIKNKVLRSVNPEKEAS